MSDRCDISSLMSPIQIIILILKIWVALSPRSLPLLQSRGNNRLRVPSQAFSWCLSKAINVTQATLQEEMCTGLLMCWRNYPFTWRVERDQLPLSLLLSRSSSKGIISASPREMQCKLKEMEYGLNGPGKNTTKMFVNLERLFSLWRWLRERVSTSLASTRLSGSFHLWGLSSLIQFQLGSTPPTPLRPVSTSPSTVTPKS